MPPSEVRRYGRWGRVRPRDGQGCGSRVRLDYVAPAPSPRPSGRYARSGPRTRGRSRCGGDAALGCGAASISAAGAMCVVASYRFHRQAKRPRCRHQVGRHAEYWRLDASAFIDVVSQERDGSADLRGHCSCETRVKAGAMGGGDGFALRVGHHVAIVRHRRIACQADADRLLRVDQVLPDAAVARDDVAAVGTVVQARGEPAAVLVTQAPVSGALRDEDAAERRLRAALSVTSPMPKCGALSAVK